MKSTRRPIEFDQNNRDVNSIPRYYQVKQQSWREARHFGKTKVVLPGETDAYKGPTGKTRTPANDTFTMIRRRRIQKVIVSHMVERTPQNVVRQNRRGEAHLHRYKSWENSKFEALSSHDKCRRRNPAITQSTTRLCSSEKRMQTIPWRAPGKDPRKIHSHSLQSTKKTAKRATIWGQRRIRLRWPLKQVGGSTKGRGPTCKQLRHRRQRGTKPIGRRALGILSILQALTTGDFSSELGQVSVASKTSSQPTGRCGQYTHKHSTYRVAQHDHVSSREHAWLTSCKAQDCTPLCPHNNCHPRVMSRPLPLLALTTSTSSLSLPFHSLLLHFRRSHFCTQALGFSTLIHPAMFHGREADQHKSLLSHLSSEIWGRIWGRNLGARTIRPQSCVDKGWKFSQAQVKGQNHILLAFRSLVMTSAMFDETPGEKICCWFCSFIAQAEQERSELSGTGHSSRIKNPCNGYHSQRRSAHERGSNSVRLRSWFIRDSTHLRGHASSPIARENSAKIKDIPMTGHVVKKHFVTTQKIQCNTENFVSILVPWLSTGSLQVHLLHR